MALSRWQDLLVSGGGESVCRANSASSTLVDSKSQVMLAAAAAVSDTSTVQTAGNSNNDVCARRVAVKKELGVPTIKAECDGATVAMVTTTTTTVAGGGGAASSVTAAINPSSTAFASLLNGNQVDEYMDDFGDCYVADAFADYPSSQLLSPLSAASLEPAYQQIYAVLDHHDEMLLEAAGGGGCGSGAASTDVSDLQRQLAADQQHMQLSFDLGQSLASPCAGGAVSPSALLLAAAEAAPVQLDGRHEEETGDAVKPPPLLPQLDWSDVQSQLPTPNVDGNDLDSIDDEKSNVICVVPSAMSVSVDDIHDPLFIAHHLDQHRGGVVDSHRQISCDDGHSQLNESGQISLSCCSPSSSSSITSSSCSLVDADMVVGVCGEQAAGGCSVVDLYDRDVLLTDCMLSSSSEHQRRRRERCLSTTSSCGGADVLATSRCIADDRCNGGGGGGGKGGGGAVGGGAVQDVSFRPDTPLSEPDCERHNRPHYLQRNRNVSAAANCSAAANTSSCQRHHSSPSSVVVSSLPTVDASASPVVDFDEHTAGGGGDCGGRHDDDDDEEATLRHHQLLVLRAMMPAAELPPPPAPSSSPSLSRATTNTNISSCKSTTAVVRSASTGGVRIVSRLSSAATGASLSSHSFAASGGVGRSLLKRNQQRLGASSHSNPAVTSSAATGAAGAAFTATAAGYCRTVDRGDHSYSASQHNLQHQQHQRRLWQQQQRAAAMSGGGNSLRHQQQQQQVYLLTPSPSQSESSSEDDSGALGSGGSWCRRHHRRQRHRHQQATTPGGYYGVSASTDVSGACSSSCLLPSSSSSSSLSSSSCFSSSSQHHPPSLSSQSSSSSSSGLMALDEPAAMYTPHHHLQRLELNAPSGTGTGTGTTQSSSATLAAHHHLTASTSAAAMMHGGHHYHHNHHPPERRHNHNSMERMRRDLLRDSLHTLRCMVPSTVGNERAAKVIVLREAAKFCVQLRNKHDQLVRHKRRLQLQRQQMLRHLQLQRGRRQHQSLETNAANVVLARR